MIINVCKFCKKEPKTLMHLFCDCEILVGFWNSVSDFTSTRLRTNIVFGKQYILFLALTGNSFLFLLNRLLICARFLIY